MLLLGDREDGEKPARREGEGTEGKEMSTVHIKLTGENLRERRVCTLRRSERGSADEDHTTRHLKPELRAEFPDVFSPLCCKALEIHSF